MALRRNDPIPDDNHVMRYVSPNRLRKDENDNVIGVLGEAFVLRDGEEGISSTWLEYFPGDQTSQIMQAIHKNRECIKVKPKSGFAIGKVGNILSECNKNSKSKKTRVVYMPNNCNKAHIEVKPMPHNDALLLELLASDTWSQLILNRDIL